MEKLNKTDFKVIKANKCLEWQTKDNHAQNVHFPTRDNSQKRTYIVIT